MTIRSLHRRLARLETLLEPKPDAGWDAQLRTLTLHELSRLAAIIDQIATRPACPEYRIEIDELVGRAEARRVAGIGREEIDALQKLDNAKTAACWHLVMALNRRGGFCHSDQPRFDVLDVTPAELITLSKLATTGTTVADFEMQSDIIHRLRFDGHRLTAAAFAAMALRGHYARRASASRD